MKQISIKAARINKDLTQKELAKRLNVSNKTVSNWENGRSVPKADKIESLCAILEMPYDQINFLPRNHL